MLDSPVMAHPLDMAMLLGVQWTGDGWLQLMLAVPVRFWIATLF